MKTLTKIVRLCLVMLIMIFRVAAAAFLSNQRGWRWKFVVQGEISPIAGGAVQDEGEGEAPKKPSS